MIYRLIIGYIILQGFFCYPCSSPAEKSVASISQYLSPKLLTGKQAPQCASREVTCRYTLLQLNSLLREKVQAVETLHADIQAVRATEEVFSPVDEQRYQRLIKNLEVCTSFVGGLKERLFSQDVGVTVTPHPYPQARYRSWGRGVYQDKKDLRCFKYADPSTLQPISFEQWVLQLSSLEKEHGIVCLGIHNNAFCYLDMKATALGPGIFFIKPESGIITNQDAGVYTSKRNVQSVRRGILEYGHAGKEYVFLDLDKQGDIVSFWEWGRYLSPEESMICLIHLTHKEGQVFLQVVEGGFEWIMLCPDGKMYGPALAYLRTRIRPYPGYPGVFQWSFVYNSMQKSPTYIYIVLNYQGNKAQYFSEQAWNEHLAMQPPQSIAADVAVVRPVLPEKVRLDGYYPIRTQLHKAT